MVSIIIGPVIIIIIIITLITITHDEVGSKFADGLSGTGEAERGDTHCRKAAVERIEGCFRRLISDQNLYEYYAETTKCDKRPKPVRVTQTDQVNPRPHSLGRA
jgi:hypothetical protein